MTETSQNSPGGYLRFFNFLTARCFATGTDGRKLFCPWGALTRGYPIPSDAAYERLNRKLKLYMIAALTVIVASALVGPLATAIVLAPLLVFYPAWLPFLLRELRCPEETRPRA